MIFYDFEVFKFDWLVVLLDTTSKQKVVIVNDKTQLEDFYSKNKNDIWVGFNNRFYDQYILKGILCDFNPKEINDYIIQENNPGWKFSGVLNKIYSIQYDVMNSLDKGLKMYEGFQGKNIKETSIPFDIDRKLTEEEIKETIEYCTYDVEETMILFLETIDDFNAHRELVKMASDTLGTGLNLTLLSKTKVQLSSIILDATKPTRKRKDEFDISFPNTLELKKYTEVKDWYEDPKNHKYKIQHENKKDTKNELSIFIARVPHIFGYGGVHGALEKYHGKGYYLNMDVASLYPSLMIEYDLLSRNCSEKGKEKYKEIYHERLRLKAEGKKAEQAPLKLVLNGTYGAMKDKNNNLYDPRQANLVCIYGQLLLLDLIEILEPHCEIVQSNTDGVLVKLKQYEDFELIDDLCYEWEKRTRLVLEFDEYKEVWQKDVNNYVIIPHGDIYDKKGKLLWKSKGLYVKKLSPLDNDLPVVNKSLVDYMVQKIPLEETFSNCNDLIMYQQVDKISYKFKHAIHGKKVLEERVIRSFASKLKSDGKLIKIHAEKGNGHKVSNTSENVFIDNSDIRDKKIPKKLDKEHYIKLAMKRLKDFTGYDYIPV